MGEDQGLNPIEYLDRFFDELRAEVRSNPKLAARLVKALGGNVVFESDTKAEVANPYALAAGPKATFMRCGLEREGLVGAEEASRVSLGELVACHAAWAWLGAGHAQTELERRLFRMLMLG